MTEIESEQVLTPAKVPESSKDMSSKKERNKIEHFEAPKCVSNSRNTKSKNRLKKLKRLRKNKITQIASDKNIGILLRSERLIDCIRKGYEIPKVIGNCIAAKTGFQNVKELNDYISANRAKFLVLADKKILNRSFNENECENRLFRSDSVDLSLYFKYHYGITLVDIDNNSINDSM